jgi:hypothetical protein
MPDEIEKFPSPLVTGGVGGSGTQVVARIARRAGFDLVTDLNSTETRCSEADGLASWRWTTPRSAYLLPLLYEYFAKLKLIHVIRDGRDMAFSKNQSQLRKHGPFMLSWWERSFYSLPKRLLLSWGAELCRCRLWGEVKLERNYRLVRFGDLRHAPVKMTARIMELLDVDVDAEAVAQAEISEPSTIGRWRNLSAARYL